MKTTAVQIVKSARFCGDSENESGKEGSSLATLQTRGFDSALMWLCCHDIRRFQVQLPILLNSAILPAEGSPLKISSGKTQGLKSVKSMFAIVIKSTRISKSAKIMKLVYQFL